MEFEIFKKRLYTGDILDYSIEYFRKNYKKLFILTLIFHVPVMIAIGLITGNGGLIGRSLQVSTSDPNVKFPIADIISLYSGIILNSLYSTYILPILSIAVIKFTYDGAIYNRYYKTRYLLGCSIKKLGWYILSMIVVGFIISSVFSILYIIIIVMILSSVSMFSANTALVVIAIILICLMVLAFIIAAIYFYVRILFIPHALILENANSFSAFTSSLKLTKKRFWRISFLYFWGYILVSFVPTLLTSLQLILPFNDFVVNRIIYALIQGGVALFYPFMHIVSTVMYTNLKAENGTLQVIKDVNELVKDEDDSIQYVNNTYVDQNIQWGGTI